ncbi:MAG: cytochrome c peroxidase [Pseudomonadota bacterium]
MAALCLSLAGASSAQTPRLSGGDFHPFDPAKAEIGRLLFYDPILSGNRNISCGTCHHHDLGTGDGLPLGVGEGGRGLGPKRNAGTGAERIRKRVPRNAPPLWNLGAREIRALFHDGRLSVADTYENGFNSPAEERLPGGLPNILAAQAVLPLVAEFEMAGHSEENEVGGARNDRVDFAWPILAKRVRTIPAYGEMFVAAFEGIDTPSEVTIVEVATVLSDFINAEWRSFDSAYDRHLAGEDSLDAAQTRGMDLFFGAAGCADCHNGALLTDHQFHALALPHFGPGRTRPFDPIVRDVGRMAETDRIEDAYRFRTPALRNVTLTAPYGHNGAYATLRGIIRHHLDPQGALAAWGPGEVTLPDAPWIEAIDFVSLQDKRERARLAAKIDITPRTLSDAQVSDLVAFLGALEGADSTQGRLGRPDAVPSGLPVD